MRKIEELNAVEFLSHITALISQAISDEQDGTDKEIQRLNLSGTRCSEDRSYLDLALQHYLSTDDTAPHKTNLGSICLLLEQSFNVTHHTSMQSDNPIVSAVIADEATAETLNRALADNPCLINVSDKRGTPIAVLLNRYMRHPEEKDTLLPLFEILLENNARPPSDTHDFGIDLMRPAHQALRLMLSRAQAITPASPRDVLDRGLPTHDAERLQLAIEKCDTTAFSHAIHEIQEYYAATCGTDFDAASEMQQALQHYRTADNQSLLDFALATYITSTAEKRNQLHGVVQILDQKYQVPYTPLNPHPLMPDGFAATSEDVCNITERLKEFPALVNIDSLHGVVLSAALLNYSSYQTDYHRSRMSHEKSNALAIIAALLKAEAFLPALTSNAHGNLSTVSTIRVTLDLTLPRNKALLELLSRYNSPQAAPAVVDGFPRIITAIQHADPALLKSEIASRLTQYHDGDSLFAALAEYRTAENFSLLDLALHTYLRLLAEGDSSDRCQIVNIIHDLQRVIKAPQSVYLTRYQHPITCALQNANDYTAEQFQLLVEQHHALVNIASDKGTPMTIAMDLYASYKRLPDASCRPKAHLLSMIKVLLDKQSVLPLFQYSRGTPTAIKTKTNTIHFDRYNQNLLNLIATYHPYLKELYAVPATSMATIGGGPLLAIAEDDAVVVVFDSTQKNTPTVAGIAGIFANRRQVKPIDTSSWPTSNTRAFR